MKKTKLIALAAMMVLASAFTGCNHSITLEPTNETQKQNEMAFVLQLPEATKGRVAYYDQSDATSYKVQLIKSGTVLKTETGNPGDKIRLTVTDEGSYTISVTAYKDIIVIAEGTSPASISLADGDVKVNVKLVPKVKEVGIDVEIEWGSGEETSNNVSTAPVEAIKIGNVTFEKTGEVYITKTPVTISGGDPHFITSSAEDYYKGVFRTGRNVTLSPYIMSKYEVTQELYAAVMAGQKVTVNGTEYTLTTAPFFCKETGTYPLVTGEIQSLRPAEGHTWYDAVYFCNALSEKSNLTKAYSITVTSVINGQITGATVELVAGANGYRLPTEAEWEFAARGGDQSKAAWNYFFSGASAADGKKSAGLDSVGWYWYNNINGITGDVEPSRGSEGYGTHEVGKKECNSLGIYDMSGNVWEWCYDWYESLTTGDFENPTGGMYVATRVRRGGSWFHSAKNASVCYRGGSNSEFRIDYLGFRVVRSAL